MNRTVRNGLAVAGMAGGIFFLGQAVASADEITVNQDNGTSNSATANGSDDGDSGAAAGSLQKNDADVDVTKDTTVTTGDTVTGENTQYVAVNTGDNYAKNNVAAIDDSKASGSITTNTGGNTVSPSITTGSANGANSPAVNNGADGVDVTVNQDNDASNRANASGGDDEGDSGALAGSAQVNDADVDVTENTTVETGDTITGQNTQVVAVNTGENYGVNNCKAYDDAVVHCTIVFNTGGNTVSPSINTGSANNANSPSVGNTAPPAVHHHHYYPAPAPAHHAKPAHQPHHHKAMAPAHHAKPTYHAPARHSAPVNRYAQPTGSLAYTGAETTAPLALGLIALGAGGVLTLAGRRRSSTATV